MMNKITRNDFTQEIAATIRAAKSGVGLSKLLKRYHQRDVAKALSLLTETERERVLRLMDVPALTAVFPYLDDAAGCLAALPEARTAEVLSGMDTADALDILQELPEEARQRLAAHLAPDVRADVRRLLAFREEEIGSRMSSNFVCIPDTLTIRGAMSELVRQAGEHDNISTLYVVDENNSFAGAIDLKDLIIARESVALEDIISQSYPTVGVHEHISECIERLKGYAEDSIPVLNEKKHLIGVITAQDIVEVVDDEMGEDYAKLGGLSSEEDLNEKTLVSMKKRIPWLIVLLFMGMLVSSVVGFFEPVVAQLAVIVCFQSLILDMAGNVGTQSLAVTIRVLMDESLTARQKLELVWKEMRIGLCNGGLLGVLALLFIGLYVWLFKGKTIHYAFCLSGCVGVSLLLSMVISSFVGTAIPMFFKKIKVDPAVASGPLITTVNDLVAVVTYYSLSWLMLVEIFHLA